MKKKILIPLFLQMSTCILAQNLTNVKEINALFINDKYECTCEHDSLKKLVVTVEKRDSSLFGINFRNYNIYSQNSIFHMKFNIQELNNKFNYVKFSDDTVFIYPLFDFEFDNMTTNYKIENEFGYKNKLVRMNNDNYYFDMYSTQLIFNIFQV